MGEVLKTKKMTAEEIEQCYELAIGDELARSNFQLTKMVSDARMAAARDEITSAYALPMLANIEYTPVAPGEGEDVDAIAKIIGMAVARLMFARLTYNNIFKTEYTTSKPDKLNGQVAERAEIMRQVAAYRRMAIESLEDLRRDYGLTGQPRKRNLIAILGEEL